MTEGNNISHRCCNMSMLLIGKTRDHDKHYRAVNCYCKLVASARRELYRGSPCKSEVHQADHGASEQRDRVRLVEKLDGNILHLLLVDHAEMKPVTDIIFAQGLRRHNSS